MKAKRDEERRKERKEEEKEEKKRAKDDKKRVKESEEAGRGLLSGIGSGSGRLPRLCSWPDLGFQPYRRRMII